MMDEVPYQHKTYHRSKTVTAVFLCVLAFAGLMGRLAYLMIFQSEYYTMKAKQLHERERSIKAARGRIVDANGKILADNKTVCTISVIHNQITDQEEVIAVLCEELGLFGAIAIILMFILLIWRLMVIANNAPDLFGALLVVGVLGHIAIQVILNIGVVTNTIPNTGISLPFISYGGSSVMFLLIEIGLCLSVAKRIQLKEL